jgi:hypothetical protein
VDDEQRYLTKLIQSLHLVAADAESQIAVLPPFVCVADEVALTYCDSYLLVNQIVEAGLLDRAFVPRLAAMEMQMSRMSGQEHTDLWTDKALRTRPEWESLRVQARAILADLGIELAPPDLGWITSVGGNRPALPRSSRNLELALA